MTPNQRAALELLAGRALSDAEASDIDGYLEDRRDDLIAEILSKKADGTPRTKLVSKHLTERGVRALAVAPRHRYALLKTLRDAEQEAPEWLAARLTAAGVPEEDHEGLADDLASAHRWLLDSDGLDIGSLAARQMLALIAQAVPASAPACAAVLALGQAADPVAARQVSDVLNSIEE